MLDKLFGEVAIWFGLPAVLGTIFFLVRLSLLLLGGDGGHGGLDMDAGVDAGADLGDIDAGSDLGDVDADHGDPGEAMKILSIQSIFTFMMGFGWGGIAALHGFGQPWHVALLWGAGTGVAMVWILGLGLKAIHDLQSSGNVSIRDAAGAEGSVYVRVPGAGEGRGQVRVVIDDRQRIFNAVTEGEPLDRNARVRIVRVNDDNTLTVAPL